MAAQSVKISGREYFKRAQRYIAEDDFKRSIDAYKKAIEKGYKKGSMHREIAYIHMKENNIRFAVDALKSALKYEIEKEVIYKELGRLYHNEGRYKMAINEFKKAVKINPDDIDTRKELAVVFERNNDLMSAVKEYEKTIDLGSNDPQTRLVIGRIYYMLGKNDLAEKFIFEAIGAGLDTAECYATLGRVYIEKNEYIKAIDELQKAVKIAPLNVEFHMDLARLYERIDINEAIVEFEKSVELGYCKTDIYLILGRLYMMKKDIKKAIRNFRKVKARFLDDVNIDFEIGKVYESSGEFEKAIQYFEKAVNASNKNNSFRIYLGNAYIRAHNKDRALELLKYAYRHAGESMESYEKNGLLNKIEMLEGKTKLNSKPPNLLVILTNKCNLNCIMCSRINYAQGVLPYDAVKKLFVIYPYIDHINWQGGEAFLVDYFKELIFETSKYPHIRQEITTNGLFFDKEWARIFSNGNIQLTCSIDSVNKETYEYIRKGAKYSKLLKSLDNIKKAKKKGNNLNMNIRVTVMKSNFKELHLFPAFCRKYGFTGLSFDKLLPELVPEEDIINGSNKKIRKELYKIITDVESECAANAISFVCDFKSDICQGPENEESSGIAEQDDGKFEGNNTKQKNTFERNFNVSCLFPWERFTVNYDGGVEPSCECESYVGNLKQESFKHIWNGEKIQLYRKYVHDGKNVKICPQECRFSKI